MERNMRAKGISAALASAVFLGVSPVFGKQAILLGFSPLAVVTIRTGLAALLLALVILIINRKFFYIFPVGLIGCGIAGLINGLGSILYYSALARLDTSVAQLLYAFYPLFVGIWLFIDRQPLNRITVLRLAMALPGAYLLISAAEHRIDWIGAVMMIGSAVLYALHLLVNQRILWEAPAQTVTFYTLLAMTATVAVGYIIFDRTLPAAGTSWWPVTGLALITAFSRLSLFMGVKRLGGLQTAIIGLSELIVTMVLARIILGDSLTLIQWIGAFLIGASIVLVGFDKPTPEKRHSKGFLSWLNPASIDPNEIPWQVQK